MQRAGQENEAPSCCTEATPQIDSPLARCPPTSSPPWEDAGRPPALVVRIEKMLPFLTLERQLPENLDTAAADVR
jgi:hypothetical protein